MSKVHLTKPKRRNLNRIVLETCWKGAWAGYQDADATRPELLVAAYDWTPGLRDVWDEAGNTLRREPIPFRDEQKAPARWPHRGFAHIPERQRDAAYAALARVLRRLEGRAWIKWGKGGYQLTDEGWAWTARMLRAPNTGRPLVTGTAL